jgi:hypothetical protein
MPVPILVETATGKVVSCGTEYERWLNTKRNIWDSFSGKGAEADGEATSSTMMTSLVVPKAKPKTTWATSKARPKAKEKKTKLKPKTKWAKSKAKLTSEVEAQIEDQSWTQIKVDHKKPWKYPALGTKWVRKQKLPKVKVM